MIDNKDQAISFLVSCIKSGEQISEQTETEIRSLQEVSVGDMLLKELQTLNLQTNELNYNIGYLIQALRDR